MRPLGRRRSIPWLVTGVLLVAGFALAFTLVSLRAGGERPVLAVTHDLPAGATLDPADLQVVRVDAGPQLDLVPASAKQRALGSTVAVPVTQGAPLTRGTLGPSDYPPKGHASVGVSVQPGRYPPGLTPGATVSVVTTPTSASGPQVQGGTGANTPAVEATVTDVQHSNASGRRQTVVALMLAEADAADVAAASATGDVSLVRLPPGGERE